MTIIELPIYGNGTLVSFDCDPANLTSVCQLLLEDFGTINYVPSLPGNVLYLAIFALILIIQIGQGIMYRTWSYLVAMIFGLVLEAVGYGARVGMHFNPWDSNSFLVYIICLTIGPVFFSACIYLCLARLIILYDPENIYAHFRPRTYTIIFLTVDFLCLVLQAAGGALADTANTPDEEWNGVHIMIAGLALQVFSLVTFSTLCAHFAFKLRRAGVTSSEEFASVGENKQLKTFIFGISLATLFVTIRSSFRVAELKDGFNGKLANEEVPFMILEGAMIVLATTCLTVFHPGRMLRSKWFVKDGSKNKV